MIQLDHDAKSFNPVDFPQDYGVFLLDKHEAAGPPRKITPYMRACAHYLAGEVESMSAPHKRGLNLIERAASLSIIAGFFALVFCIPWLVLSGIGSPPYPSLLSVIASTSMIAWSVAFHVTQGRRLKRGYGFLLENGKLVEAIVKQHMVVQGMVRELKYHKPVIRDGVPAYEREWVMQSRITLAIGDIEIEVLTFRPEIISVCEAGKTIAVIWHPKYPGLFIPVEK